MTQVKARGSSISSANMAGPPARKWVFNRSPVAGQQTPEAVSIIMSDPTGGETHANHPLGKIIDAADAAHCLEAMAQSGCSV
jgi:hypothetical protein